MLSFVNISASTFAATTGREQHAQAVCFPLPKAADTFVYTVYKLWNMYAMLREATSLGTARRAAVVIVKTVPM